MSKETRSLSRSQRVVEFTNGTRVEAGPFAGTLTQWRPAGPGLRTARLAAERDVSPDFAAALADVGIVEQETIDLDVEGGTAALRSMSRQAAAADRVVIRPAPPRRDAVQVIWYQDESGGVSWHFPDGFLERAKVGRSPEGTQRSVRRAAHGATFTIRTRTAGARRAFATGQPSTRLRGPIVKLGRKIFKVLMVPLSKVIARPLEKIVGRIEGKKRQELIRRLTADDYRRLVTEPFSDWKSLDGKRSLLVVHGIFSSTHGMLSGFPPMAMERLIAAYGGRAIALDQITVSRSPEQNAADFLRGVKKARPNGRFEFDVLCHSRGGVVSRTLAERGRSLVPDHNCSFRSVYFVAAPNAGSPLADAEHMVEMIDVFTNLITNFPDGPVLYAIEIVLAIVKLIAYTAETRLPGIAAMGTEGYIPGVLNAAPAPDPAPRYAASCSDYEPGSGDNGLLNGRLADSVIDRVFGQAADDLVTPRDGVFAANGHPLFPIAGPVVYDASEHVWHSDFFRRRRTLEAIFDHFEVDLGGGFELSAAAGDEEEVVDADEPAAEEEEADLDEMVEELLGADAGDEVSVTNGGRRGGTVAEPPRGLGFGGGGGFRAGGGPERRRAAAAGRGGRAPARRPGVRRSRRRAAEAPQPPTRRSRRAPATTPERIERRPEIDFHEQVREGQTNNLVVRLADVAAAGGGGGRMAIDFAAEEESVELTVRLHASGFDVEPSAAAKPMTVHRVRRPESEEVRFSLTARDPGPQPVRREVTAEFWLRNALIGAVTHYTFVVPRDHAGGPARRKLAGRGIRPAAGAAAGLRRDRDDRGEGSAGPAAVPGSPAQRDSGLRGRLARLRSARPAGRRPRQIRAHRAGEDHRPLSGARRADRAGVRGRAGGVGPEVPHRSRGPRQEALDLPAQGLPRRVLLLSPRRRLAPVDPRPLRRDGLPVGVGDPHRRRRYLRGAAAARRQPRPRSMAAGAADEAVAAAAAGGQVRGAQPDLPET